MRVRKVLWGLGALAVLVAGFTGGVALYERGPGVEKEASRLAEVLPLRPGMMVADVGAGTGRIAVRVAQLIGPSGRVYATEIDSGLLNDIRARAESAGVANVPVVQASASSTGLLDACCDAIYMRRVYHHITEPVPVAEGLYAALRPGGRLVVIDFITPRWLFFLHHGVAASVPRDQLVAAGFVLERRIERWSALAYALVFRKPAPPQPGSRPTSD